MTDSTDGVPDPIAEQLVAYDLHLAGAVQDAMPSPPPEVSEDLRHELEPAFDCLRLLKELRIEKTRSRVTRPADETKPAVPIVWPGDCSGGEVAFGRFLLRKELGRGGFGVVFLAFDPLLNREVALKLPRPDCLMNAELRRRFLHEGRAVAGLEHGNIVPVHEAGEINGIYYLASPFIAGPSLAEWLRRRSEPVSLATAARLIADLADGVEHAHRNGILHRDLKPANILLTRTADSLLAEEFVPKITDFGLAKLLDMPGEQTRSGLMLGTPQYMAPEQAEGRTHAVGPSTDVYALGVVLYEMLTRTTPFAGSSGLELLRRVTSDEAVSPRRIRRDIPRDLESICLMCLQKAPGGRYATAGELAADLRRFLRGEPVTARLPSTLEQAAKWARRRPTIAGLLAVALLALIGLAGTLFWHYLQIKSKNFSLQAAVEDANQQRELARANAAQARMNAYGAQVHVTSELWHDKQIGLIGEVLNRLRPGPDEEDLREFAWRYLWEQARNEQWLRGHQGPIIDVAFSETGGFVASASEDRTVKLWESDSGRLRATLTGFETEPRSLAIFPDGKTIVAMNKKGLGGEGKNGAIEIRTWDTTTGKPGSLLQDSSEVASAVTVAPDGQTVAFGRSNLDGAGAVCLWNVNTGVRRFLLRTVSLGRALAFSPQGERLAVACQEKGSLKSRIILLDPHNGEQQLRLPLQPMEVESLAFSPDGATLVSGCFDGTVRSWEVASGKELMLLHSGKWPVRHVAYSADGRTLAIYADVHPHSSIVYLRDSATGALRCEPYGPSTLSTSMALNADGSLLALGGVDHVVRLVKVKPEAPFFDLKAHPVETWGLAFSRDSHTLVTSSDDGTAKLWDEIKKNERATLRGHVSLVSCVALSPTEMWLATGSYDRTVKLWDLVTGKMLGTLTGHTAPVRAVVFSPDGHLLASAGRDKTVKLWNPATHQVLATLAGHTNDVRGLAFSRDGSLLASVGDDRSLCFWDVASRTKQYEVVEPGQIWAVAFSPDGKLLATGGADGTPKIWNLETREPRAVIGGHLAGVTAVAFSPDGKTMASGGIDQTVRLWHVATGQELICFKGLAHQVNAVAFSPNGQFLAAALHDGRVRLWRTQVSP